MLSPYRRVRLRFSPVSFVAALATATAAAPADASISTSHSDLYPESHGPVDASILRSRMRTSAAEGNLAISEAREIINVMEQAGLFPDYFTISSLAAGFLKAGHVKTWQNFIQMVCNRCNLVDIATWNIYLHSLCCDGQVKKALALVSGMMERGLLPSTTTCNTILKGFCMELDLQRALQMLDYFSSTGVLYDSVSFNTILSAACRQQNALVIHMVLYRMNVEGINLDTISMTCLL